MKDILLIKLDGIGDYLFFRLFWPQIKKFSIEKQINLSFLCSECFLPLVEKYDFKYIRNYFTLSDVNKWKKARLLLFIPQYYKKFRRGEYVHDLWERNWSAVYNLQPLREVLLETTMKKVHSFKKISNKAINKLLAPNDFYQDEIYSQFLEISSQQFALSFFKELLEKSFNHPFQLPRLELPFSKQEIQKTLLRKKIKTPYILFVPFTSTPLRNWPLEHFVSLAQKLEKKLPFPIILIGKQKKYSKKIWKHCPNVVDLTNKTSLFEGMQIAAGATYAVCSDTSLMHCALMGGANTISLSCGRAKEMFVNYPATTGVKQKIFYPSPCDEQGIGLIENIDPLPVWQYIKENWPVSQNT